VSNFAERERTGRRWVVRIARGAVLALLVFFTFSLAFGRSSWVFLDNVNLLLHEAGHFLFRPLGDTLAALGGTLHQLLWPGLLALYFGWRRRDRFAILVCLWWVGENLLGIAVYMRDAINLGLPLVGGETHDWNYLFTRWGVLRSCLGIGSAVRISGWILMASGLAGALWLAFFPSRRDVDRVDEPPPQA
jgi:hypothetical protein